MTEDEHERGLRWAFDERWTGALSGHRFIDNVKWRHDNEVIFARFYCTDPAASSPGDWFFMVTRRARTFAKRHSNGWERRIRATRFYHRPWYRARAWLDAKLPKLRELEGRWHMRRAERETTAPMVF